MPAVDIDSWFLRSGEAVYRRCVQIVGDASLARDVMHDTFVRAYGYRMTFRGGSALAWLLAIANRLALDHLKAARVVPTATDVERLLSFEAGDGDNPEQLDRRVVAQLLARADERSRQIVMHRYYDELDLQAIADRLEINERTVRRRLEQFLDDARAFLTRS